MNGALLKLGITTAVGCLLFSRPTGAQVIPPARKAARVAIKRGPELELARDDAAIIRWTTSNPGGAGDHFGVVYYGTDPKNLSKMAKSHIKLNRGHPETTFRVRVDGLKPRTTYYYKATSMESNGKSVGLESSVKQFNTTGPGERSLAHPPTPVPRRGRLRPQARPDRDRL